MKQYCRYCTNAMLIDEDIAYCKIKHSQRPKSICITTNSCNYFIFNEVDVFDSVRRYQPKQVKKTFGTQIKLEG